jgi:cytochrome P450
MRVPSSPVDLVAPDAITDPLRIFEELRRGGDAWWLERHKAWLLLGYELNREALSLEQLSTDNITPLQRHLSAEDRARFKPAADLLAGWMIFNDPPTHTALRHPVRAAFTPRAVARLEASTAALVDRLLDAVDPAGFDVVDDLAYPLPAIVIAHLLGVPADRHQEFQGWSRQLGALVMGKVSRPDAWDRALAAARDLEELFSVMIEDRRAHPSEDLVSTLVHGSKEDGALTDHQLVGALSLLLFGGHETTTSLLTTGALHLMGAPERQRRLAADPGPAVEELLRYEGPSKIVVRRVRYDGEWQGLALKAGQPVFCALMAGNHDPAQFESPGELRLDRDPNRHLSFGWGLHFCLGSQLARLEARIVLPRLFERFPDLELAVPREELRWQPTVVGRTLRRLPVRSAAAVREHLPL